MIGPGSAHSMLTVSMQASAAIDALLHNPSAPDNAALRITHDNSANGSPSLALAIVDAPEPDDAVVETSAGDDVYLAPAAAETLDEMELDASMDGERITFTVHPQT